MSNTCGNSTLRKKTLSVLVACLLGGSLLGLPALAQAGSAAPRAAAMSAQDTKDMVFNWIEGRYLDMFSPPLKSSQTGNGYYYRYYPNSGTYLGEKDGLIQAWLPPLGLVTLGTLADLSQKAQAEMQPKAGDPVFTTAKLNGTPFLEQTYRYYGVDGEGNLLDAANKGTPVGHVAVLESQKQLATQPVQGFVATLDQEPLPLATIAAFYKELWAAMAAYYPQKSGDEIAREIGDLDASLEDLYYDVRNSGLSTRDYVVFYETVDKYLGEANTEGELDSFMENIGMTPATLLSTLQTVGVSWDDVLVRMASSKTGFAKLLQSYTVSGQGLGNFLQGFARNGSMSGSFAADPAKTAVDAAKVAVKAGELGLKIAKFAWEIIKDGRPKTTAEDAYTSVLSIKDTSYENYAYAKQGNSPYIEWEGKNLFTMRLFYAKFNLGGYYGATHPTIGGKWMPSIAFKVDDAFAAFTWNLNAGAAITSAANLASTAAPQPEIQVVAKLQANGWFQSFTKSFTFYANGETGFRRE